MFFKIFLQNYACYLRLCRKWGESYEKWDEFQANTSLASLFFSIKTYIKSKCKVEQTSFFITLAKSRFYTQWRPYNLLKQPIMEASSSPCQKKFDEQEMEVIIKPLYEKKQEFVGLTPLEIAKQFAQKVNPVGREIDLSQFDVYDQ